MKTNLGILIALFSAVALFAQSPVPVQKEQMAKLDWLKGDWKGNGWMVRGPSDRKEFNQTETVRGRLNDLVIIIEGHGRSTEDGTTIHHALAFVSYDVGEKKFRVRAFTGEGGQVDTEGKAGEKQFVWGFEVPGRGEIRYTVRLTAKGEWHEIGEFSADGTNWNKFLEMTLEKSE